jgi:hypothetical protein
MQPQFAPYDPFLIGLHLMFIGTSATGRGGSPFLTGLNGSLYVSLENAPKLSTTEADFCIGLAYLKPSGWRHFARCLFASIISNCPAAKYGSLVPSGLLCKMRRNRRQQCSSGPADRGRVWRWADWQ